jgi:3-oxo-5-alpha-steroid 4-dehydrogenase 3
MEETNLLQRLLTPLSGITPAQWCQAFFLLSATGVAAVAAMPRDAKALLVDYGARKAPTIAESGPAAQDKPSASQQAPDRGSLLTFIDNVTSWTQVPHSWFGAFYVVSLACSAFWLAQYLGDGAVLRFIAASQESSAQHQQPPWRSSTLTQAAVGWLMMILQAGRRVYEHAAVIKPSKSTMWVVHWLLGLAFYLAMSVAVWVEASGKTPPRGSRETQVWLTAAQVRYWTRRPVAQKMMQRPG